MCTRRKFENRYRYEIETAKIPERAGLLGTAGITIAKEGIQKYSCLNRV